MANWNGYERRRKQRDRGDSDEVHTYLANGLRDVQRGQSDLHQDQLQLRRDFKCMHDKVKEFMPLLQAISKREQYRERMQTSVRDKALVGVIVGVTLSALGFMFWAAVVLVRSLLRGEIPWS